MDFRPIPDFGKTSLPYEFLVMIIKELGFKKSNKQAQRVFNKIYTNESTNRERIRFYSTSVSDSIKLPAAYWNRGCCTCKRTFSEYQIFRWQFLHHHKKHDKYIFLFRGRLFFRDRLPPFYNVSSIRPADQTQRNQFFCHHFP